MAIKRYLLFICLAVNYGDTIARCPNGWEPLYAMCYKYEAVGHSWADAESSCLSKNAHLVSIHSEVEQSFVSNMVAIRLSYANAESNLLRSWIGLRMAADGRELSWADHSDLNFTWYNPELFEEGGKCLANDVYWGWMLTACNTSLPFVCKKHGTRPFPPSSQTWRWGYALMPVLQLGRSRKINGSVLEPEKTQQLSRDFGPYLTNPFNLKDTNFVNPTDNGNKAFSSPENETLLQISNKSLIGVAQTTTAKSKVQKIDEQLMINPKSPNILTISPIPNDTIAQQKPQKISGEVPHATNPNTYIPSVPLQESSRPNQPSFKAEPNQATAQPQHLAFSAGPVQTQQPFIQRPIPEFGPEGSVPDTAFQSANTSQPTSQQSLVPILDSVVNEPTMSNYPDSSNPEQLQESPTSTIPLQNPGIDREAVPSPAYPKNYMGQGSPSHGYLPQPPRQMEVPSNFLEKVREPAVSDPQFPSSHTVIPNLETLGRLQQPSTMKGLANPSSVPRQPSVRTDQLIETQSPNYYKNKNPPFPQMPSFQPKPPSAEPTASVLPHQQSVQGQYFNLEENGSVPPPPKIGSSSQISPQQNLQANPQSIGEESAISRGPNLVYSTTKSLQHPQGVVGKGQQIIGEEDLPLSTSYPGIYTTVPNPAQPSVQPQLPLTANGSYVNPSIYSGYVGQNTLQNPSLQPKQPSSTPHVQAPSVPSIVHSQPSMDPQAPRIVSGASSPYPGYQSIFPAQPPLQPSFGTEPPSIGSESIVNDSPSYYQSKGSSIHQHLPVNRQFPTEEPPVSGRLNTYATQSIPRQLSIRPKPPSVGGEHATAPAADPGIPSIEPRPSSIGGRYPSAPAVISGQPSAEQTLLKPVEEAYVPIPSYPSVYTANSVPQQPPPRQPSIQSIPSSIGEGPNLATSQPVAYPKATPIPRNTLYIQPQLTKPGDRTPVSSPLEINTYTEAETPPLNQDVINEEPPQTVLPTHEKSILSVSSFSVEPKGPEGSINEVEYNTYLAPGSISDPSAASLPKTGQVQMPPKLPVNSELPTIEQSGIGDPVIVDGQVLGYPPSIPLDSSGNPVLDKTPPLAIPVVYTSMAPIRQFYKRSIEKAESRDTRRSS